MFKVQAIVNQKQSCYLEENLFELYFPMLREAEIPLWNTRGRQLI